MRFCLILIAVIAHLSPLCASTFAASDEAAPSPVLDSLTSEEAQKLYQMSLAKMCTDLLKSRSAQMPFESECGPWPGMQVPTASMLGLILLGEGNTLIKGPHAAALRKLVVYVRRSGPSPHESIDNYRTWVLSFSLLFLGEVHRVAPSGELKKSLQDMVKMLEAAAYEKGGWGHTLEHERNSYGAFVAVSIWAMAALQTAREQGIEVDAKMLDRNLAWLRQSIRSKSGGGFYSASSQSLVSPGRAAGVVWVLHHWDRTASQKQIDQGCRFIAAHAALTPEGHASGMMNFGWGALAAGEVGGPFAQDYWKVQTKAIYTARRDDGSFSPQPWRDLGFLDHIKAEPIEQQAKEPAADTTAGDAWASVWMLSSWQAARGKSLLCGKREK